MLLWFGKELVGYQPTMMMIYTCKRLAVLALIFGKYQVCCFIMNFVKQVARIKYYTIKKKNHCLSANHRWQPETGCHSSCYRWVKNVSLNDLLHYGRRHSSVSALLEVGSCLRRCNRVACASTVKDFQHIHACVSHFAENKDGWHVGTSSYLVPLWSCGARVCAVAAVSSSRW